jgi:DNA polymerase-3 subunit delta'
MRFSEIIGNSELKEQLVRMVRAQRLGHAILFVEESGGGGFAFALALAQYVNCREPEEDDACGVCPSCHKYQKLIHPDLHFVFPVSSSSQLSESEKKAPLSDYFLPAFRELALANPYFTEQELYDAIGIENKSGLISVHESRRIFEKLSLRAAEGAWKTMLIYLPEKMNLDAANKLLKLLEEPPAGTLFLLVSHQPERLLPTIRSRCQAIVLKPLSREERRRIAGGRDSDNAEYREIAKSLLEAGLAKRIIDTFPQWEMLADLGREKQREWCLYMEQYIRKIYLVARGLDSLADLSEPEEATIRGFAARIKPTFYEKAFTALEATLAAVGSNVNPKLAFCDLSNRLLLAL